MWAQQIVAPSRLSLTMVPDVEDSDLYPGAVLLRMLAGGICGSDGPKFRGEKVGWTNLEYRFGGASRIFLFYDAGVYYREDSGWEFLDGIGFGLMSSSRLGTVALSFGMGERVALDGMLIHISLIENF